MKSDRPFRYIVGVLGILVVSAGAGGAWWLIQQNSLAPVVQSPQKPPGSSLSQITLTEVDPQGKLLWEITAKEAEYTQNNRRVQITAIKGKFFKDGKRLMDITGNSGSINQSTQEITIEGQVKAIAVKDNIILTSDRMVWLSKKDLLTATSKQRIKVTNPDQKITITGKLLKANPGANRFTIEQDVIATAVKPSLEIKSRILTWDATQNKVVSPVPMAILHTTDQMRLNADQGEWRIKSQQVYLQGNIKGYAPASGINVETSVLVWDILQQLVTLPASLLVSSPLRQVAIAANQGQVNLATQTINLSGDIKADAKLNQAIVTADTANWVIPAQIITAQGNIRYSQVEKNIKLTGSKAVANLADQTIKVTGADVITQITP